ncbi:beta-L-arabinofuranosidase domain-containing protein [Lentzea sp. NBRC 105346]|uniref:beta-L-arabinofuranosidase domain-containing protein n=1 Tax=Lentzea sp. NBRC 105346 TaxID=3032205 RepID=UPI002554E232|nr:beta-L-arabinofuranosidase domain-containing protein [Lentzea sp. NBRC 105346]
MLYEKSARRAVEWLLEHTPPEDVVAHYKVPALFCLAGYPREAQRRLDFIEARFGTEDGDFVTAPGVKSSHEAFQEFWCYPNGWIALAAHRRGAFVLARRAYRHLLTYEAPAGGCCANRLGIPDALSTAHLGCVALQLGDVTTARDAGRWLSELLTRQNGPEFRVRGLVEDTSFLHVVHPDEPDQAYFMLGYPMAFLAKLYQVTGDMQALQAAVAFADYAFRCGDRLVTSRLAHKVAWGAAVLARTTGEQRYARLATAIADNLVAAQAADGCWSPDAEDVQKFDDTAEVALWLLEISADLAG